MKLGKHPRRYGKPSNQFLARQARKITTEGGAIRIFLDDERPCPLGWMPARTPKAFQDYLDGELSQDICELSLDWYLGIGVCNGEAIAEDLAQRFAADPQFLPRLQRISFHSSDFDAARRMLRIIHMAMNPDRELDVRLDIRQLN